MDSHSSRRQRPVGRTACHRGSPHRLL